MYTGLRSRKLSNGDSKRLLETLPESRYLMKEDDINGENTSHIYLRTENKTILRITFDLRQHDYKLSQLNTPTSQKTLLGNTELQKQQILVGS